MPVSSSINFGPARGRMRRRLPSALDAAGHVALDASNELIPELTGEMAGTGGVTVDDDRAAIAYTHPAAAVQHERLDYHHDDGQAKFLETAVARTRAEQARALAGKLREELR